MQVGSPPSQRPAAPAGAPLRLGQWCTADLSARCRLLPQVLEGREPTLPTFGLPGSPTASDHFDCLGDELGELAKLLEDDS
jgi:hypothetical protein